MPTVRTAPQYLAIAALLAAAQPLAPRRGRRWAQPQRLLRRRPCRLPVRQPQRHARRSDRSSLGRRHLALQRAARRRAGRLRALLPVAPDAGHRARWILSRLSRRPAGPVVPRHQHRDGQRRARVAGEPARPHRLRHGRMDALRHRRHRLGQHALLASRPHDRQRGRQPQQHPAGLRAGRRRRLPPGCALVGAGRVSLHQLRPRRLCLRLGAGTLRFPVRPAPDPRRA